ncbi:MAG: L-2-amino-thiazoline-4-carboxylic acid hydrolase [Chloroflexi bacterium]|nr:L-2-amino-thiazoline-4-carboxylic acid hydrolase [Chloroflexota bacterium]
MEQELVAIFTKTINAHFPAKVGITKDEYLKRFKAMLAREITDAPKLDTANGNLAAYIKLSVLVMTMVQLYKGIGLSEYEIGEFIYRTADTHYRLSPIKKWIRRMLFFSRLNRKQILKRQEMSERLENGINGFKIKYVEGTNPNEFGVDYLQCGICAYFARKNLFEYVKYCCLVDYVIMKNMGISFSRTTTLGNGGKKCDLRFAKEGRIKDGWPPINLQEFNRNG